MRLSHNSKFLSNTDGSITILGLFFLVACIAVAGLGLDVMHAMSTRTHLQVAGDSAAHAALISRQNFSEAESKAIGVSVAKMALPTGKYGNSIQTSDIQFGRWDAEKKSFTASAGEDDAVLVDVQQAAARNNALGMYFLRFAGIWSMDVSWQSVFETYVPTCMREGFVADLKVDVTTGNTYTPGFCIHANTYVELNNDNTFHDGVIVSMPDKNDIVLPSDGTSSNTGLSKALRDGAYELNVMRRIEEFIAGLQDKNSDYYRSYITNSEVLDISCVLSGKGCLGADEPGLTQIEMAWEEGRIHNVTCTKPSDFLQVKSSTNTPFRNGILITNCQVKLNDYQAFENMVLVSTNTNTQADGYAVTAASNFRLGRDDNCAAGNDAQILTYGAVKIAQSFESYGGQIIAGENIVFTADAVGISGISLIAGGEIRGTTDSVIGFCGGAQMDNSFLPEYFRMAF